MSEKIWLKHYPAGVPAEINTHSYESLADLFEQSCNKYADRPVVSNFGSQLTYRQLEKLSGHFAAWLQQVLQLKKGDRIAIMLPNVMQYYIVMFAALRVGIVVVNINPLYTAPELVHQLNDAKVDTIVVLANFADTVAQAFPQTSLKHVIITEFGDSLGVVKSYVANFIVRYIKKLVPAYHFSKVITFKEALAAGKKYSLQKVKLTHTDIAYLQYTGGTTGIPKAAVLTHGCMVANIEQAYAWVATIADLNEGHEIIVVPLPLYHIFSLTVAALCFFKMGTLAVLITNPKDLHGFVKQLASIHYTALLGINTLLAALLQRDDFKKLSFKHLHLVMAGGMPMQKTVADQWLAVTGVPVLEGYGLTEASPIVTINPTNLQVFNGSIGLPVPSTNVVIRDEDGNNMPIGVEGELCVKGPQVMKEYWRNPSETAQVFSADGWLKTGDIARFDEQGFLYLVGRKKEMILVSGFNVYPSEVENIIMKHPGVLETAVIGMPSKGSGETVKAFIVKKNPADNLTETDIINFCHQSLTRYKVPKIVEFVDGLPKSNVGKILRRKLLER